MEPMTIKIKRVLWSPKDEKDVISLWEEFGNDLRKEKRNANVYEEISRRMNGKFSAREIHFKIGNLTQRYRTEQKEYGASSTWIYYNNVQQIIESNVANNNNNNNANITNEASFSNDIPEDPLLVPLDDKSPSPSLSRSASHSPDSQSMLTKEESDAPGTSNTKKRRKINYDKEILKNIEKQTQLYETQLSLLKNMCEDFSAFLQRQEHRENAFLEILQKLEEKL